MEIYSLRTSEFAKAVVCAISLLEDIYLEKFRSSSLSIASNVASFRCSFKYRFKKRGVASVHGSTSLISVAGNSISRIWQWKILVSGYINSLSYRNRLFLVGYVRCNYERDQCQFHQSSFAKYLPNHYNLYGD
jgi:hypothetical protein